jgi:hypothetical protein
MVRATRRHVAEIADYAGFVLRAKVVPGLKNETWGTGDLADVEGLIGTAEKEREDAASGLAQGEIAECCGICTHYENTCNRNENISRAANRSCLIGKQIVDSGTVLSYFPGQTLMPVPVVFRKSLAELVRHDKYEIYRPE